MFTDYSWFLWTDLMVYYQFNYMFQTDSWIIIKFPRWIFITCVHYNLFMQTDYSWCIVIIHKCRWLAFHGKCWALNQSSWMSVTHLTLVHEHMRQLVFDSLVMTSPHQVAAPWKVSPLRKDCPCRATYSTHTAGRLGRDIRDWSS